ncbi:hypothetical protein [Streptomyces collinus]|uniref:hypothetical protein n=1 Tax=Streptomyces collinus TaxID=42684 RepID=UPI0029437E23|nr:hypothetical protein [Streptomyces collinus]
MPRPDGLARAALRFKPSAFAGTLVALALAAMIVAACGILLETGVRAEVPPQRYAHATVVAAADQQARTGHGDDGDHRPVPGRARLDASLVAAAATAPGARTAVADVGFPVRGPHGTARTAHNRSSTAFTGERLTTGRAPRAGEAVLSHGTVGSRITLTTPDGTRTAYRVCRCCAWSTGRPCWSSSPASPSARASPWPPWCPW